MKPDQINPTNLDNFDAPTRRKALVALVRTVDTRPVDLTDNSEPPTNVHLHTFFSYNAMGYSPTRIAWEARRAGLAAAGIVDFDVLDGCAEFYEAARMLGVRACAGMETRVFIPDLSDVVINSPGEPGIAYHMGIGFPRGERRTEAAPAVDRLRTVAGERTRVMIERVNAFLAPVCIDYAADVLPLTPAGNATERHLCLAYARKATAHFPARSERLAFWTQGLGPHGEGLADPDGLDLQQRLRTAAMKRGGPGYVAPDRGAFPTLAEMNRTVRDLGALPTVAWLDGSTDGERDPDALLRMHRKAGAVVLNIIPARNFSHEQPDPKRERLYAIADWARTHDMPMIAGTEMNAPGQAFHDDIRAPALAPLARDFLRGALIACGHIALESAACLGYLSSWAQARLADLAARNRFYETVGAALDPRAPEAPHGIHGGLDPDTVLDRLAAARPPTRKMEAT